MYSDGFSELPLSPTGGLQKIECGLLYVHESYSSKSTTGCQGVVVQKIFDVIAILLSYAVEEDQ